jgi:acetyltransferase-like isoleucine patch superfamily enzyme
MFMKQTKEPVLRRSPVIGHGGSVGRSSIVHENVILGDNVTIEEFCIIGYPTPLANGKPLVIGDNALIRSHSVFYEGSTFGPGLTTGHRVTVREGFRAGTALQIGTLCDFEGGTVGDYVRIHSSVTMAPGTVVGNCVWIFPGTVLTNDPHPPCDACLTGVTVEDYAVIATHSTILPGVRIGARSLVGAHSLVRHDVLPDTVVVGVPARHVGQTSDIQLRDGSGPAYPWMRRFHRGYPEELVRQWEAEYGRLAVR